MEKPENDSPATAGTKKPKISMIVATGNNNEIGIDGKLPWHLPEDLAQFKALTMGKAVLMGRLTFESIGKPLPGRMNLVLTLNPDWEHAGAIPVSTPRMGVTLAQWEGHKEVMVIGGEEVYRAMLPLATTIYKTEVDIDVPGADTFFPELPESEWERAGRIPGPESAAHRFFFSVYNRK